MIEWYKDKNLKIYFNTFPEIVVQYPNYLQSIDEKKSCSKKPFILKNDFVVDIHDLLADTLYTFDIKSNYSWDGASIPRFFWRFIGSNTDSRFLIPSLIHDYMCENHNLINNDRYLADKIFERLLYVSGVCNFNRWLMFHSVDNYQKFCNWGENVK